MQQRLVDGRPYLLGDEFTAADLAFAAMAAICVLPKQYGTALPPIEALDDSAQQWIAESREHPAGRFAMRIYEDRPAVRAEFLREHAPIPPSAATV